jgi:protein CpxP
MFMAMANTPKKENVATKVVRLPVQRNPGEFCAASRNFCRLGCFYSQTPGRASRPKDERQGKTMKNLRTSILAAAFAAVLALPAAFAQGTDAPADQHQGRHGRHGDMEARHKQRAEMLAQKLGLTDAQRSELKAFHEQQKAKMDAIRNNDQLTREEKRAQMKALKAERKAKMDSILTAEQKTKFEELRKEHRGMHGKRGGFRGGPDSKGPGGAGENN